jgi:hypothetical protein
MIYSQKQVLDAIFTVLPNMQDIYLNNNYDLPLLLNMAAIEIFMHIEPNKEWFGCEYIIRVALWELKYDGFMKFDVN